MQATHNTTHSFPFPPSPTATNSTASSWIHPGPSVTSSNPWSPGTPSNVTTRSNSLSSIVSSASFPLSPFINVKLPQSAQAESFDFGTRGQTQPETKIRRFGEGWKSTLSDLNYLDVGKGLNVSLDSPHTPPPFHSFLPVDDPSALTPIGPSRRNPSLPILPSHHQGILGNDNIDPIPTLGGLSIHSNLPFNSHPHFVDPFNSPYSPYPQYQAPIDPRHVPTPTFTPKKPALTHRQSVPNLERSQRRRESVRFSENLLAYDEQEGDDLPLRLRVGPRSLSSLSGETKKRNVYIHLLPAEVSEHTLRDYAEVFGRVLSIRVAVEEGKGVLGRNQNRTYAFVMLETPDQAGAFIVAIRSRGIPCEYAKEDWQTEYKAREDRTSSNIYVVGLPMEWGKEEVDEYMTQFGRVASSRLLEDKEGNRRGPVLIRFDSRPQAERAIKILDGQAHPATGERIQARIADSDGQKDYKKLRTSASSDLLVDDRESATIDERPDFGQLLNRREQLTRDIQIVNAQLNALAGPEYPISPPFYDSYPMTSPTYHLQSEYDPLITPPPHQSVYASPQPWRHRQLSISDDYKPWDHNSPVSSGPIGSYSAGQNRRGGFSQAEEMSTTAAGLHYARSTPELGRKVDNSPAKLLWPNQ